jgi:hypothetical protein
MLGGLVSFSLMLPICSFAFFFFSMSYLKGSLVVVLLLMDVHVSNFCQRYTCLRSQALQVLLLLQLECMFVAWILVAPDIAAALKIFLDYGKRTDIWHLVLLGEKILFKESPPSIMVTRNPNWSTEILWLGIGYVKGKILSPLKRSA